jgi:16S rRNA U1498 N3-methylase RsmE
LIKELLKKILVSFTRKYDSIVAAIEQSKDLTIMSVAKLISFLEIHDKRLSSYEEDFIESVFQSKLNIRS